MPYTISATALGELAMSGLCYRCVWIKMKSSRLPYQSFPGIFSTIDRYVKRMVHTHFEREGKLPGWYPWKRKRRAKVRRKSGKWNPTLSAT